MSVCTNATSTCSGPGSRSKPAVKSRALGRLIGPVARDRKTEAAAGLDLPKGADLNVACCTLLRVHQQLVRLKAIKEHYAEG